MSVQQLVAIYLATHTITLYAPGVAASRLRWYMTSHPTRNLPLSLGVVGRW
jgi:hypothetical protein